MPLASSVDALRIAQLEAEKADLTKILRENSETFWHDRAVDLNGRLTTLIDSCEDASHLLQAALGRAGRILEEGIAKARKKEG